MRRSSGACGIGEEGRLAPFPLADYWLHDAPTLLGLVAAYPRGRRGNDDAPFTLRLRHDLESSVAGVVAVVSLSEQQAVALAARLSGTRFSIDSTDDDQIDANRLVVETVTLGAGSPAIGRPVNDIRLTGDPEAAVLAVIRDGTPELVEDDTMGPPQPGDPVVIAARRQYLLAVVRELAG